MSEGPNVARTALLASLGIGVGFGALATQKEWFVPPAPSASASVASPAPTPTRAPPLPSGPRREPLELSEDQLEKGHWECSMPDPGAGIYGPVATLPRGGHLAIPRSGGHTDDFGYDVILHFHGFGPVRKSVVTVAKGAVFAGFDMGNGSSAYDEPLADPAVYGAMKASIETALKAQSGDERAHIRHLALSAWSAGYGAINSILRRGNEGIDAVVLLDGLHASFKPKGRHDDPASVETVGIAPIVSFAQLALMGEKIFYFSHSRIKTEGYASTSMMARVLAGKLGFKLVSAPPTDDPLGLLAYVDDAGFHVRTFGGDDKRAHCDHTRHMAEVVRDLLEPAWQTPPAGPLPRRSERIDRRRA